MIMLGLIQSPEDQSNGLPPQESPEIRARVTATLVMTEPVGGIVSIELPSLQRSSLRPSDVGRKAIYILSAPSEDGRVAFVTQGRKRTYQMYLLERDGSETLLVTGKGDPLWDHSISPIALAPRGGRIAFIAQSKENEGKRFRPRGPGPMRLWDPEAGAVRDLGVTAASQRPSWFPDGRRLAYVSPVKGSLEIPSRDFGDTAPPLPHVHVIDTNTGHDVPFTTGHFPIVSSDGRSMIVERRRAEYVKVEVETGTEQALPWLAHFGRPIALVESRYVIYWGRPTPGAPTGVTKNNSNFVGPKPMSAIKVVDIDTNQFATLVPLVDPRTHVEIFALAAHPD